MAWQIKERAANSLSWIQ